MPQRCLCPHISKSDVSKKRREREKGRKAENAKNIRAPRFTSWGGYRFFGRRRWNLPPKHFYAPAARDFCLRIVCLTFLRVRVSENLTRRSVRRRWKNREIVGNPNSRGIDANRRYSIAARQQAESRNDLVMLIKFCRLSLPTERSRRRRFPSGRVLHSIKLAGNQDWDRPAAPASVRWHISFVNSLFARGVTRIIFRRPSAPRVSLSRFLLLSLARSLALPSVLARLGSIFVIYHLYAARQRATGATAADASASRRNDPPMSLE